MRVKISETVEVTDEQRRSIAQKADEGGGGRAREATRVECRDFIWRHGSDWAELLDRADTYTEDLIGDTGQGDLLGELI
jgi:hypothetical protein